VKSLVRTIALGFLIVAAPALHAQHYVEREVMIPWTKALPNGLHALLVYVDLPGKHPLVVLTHGSSRNKKEHAEVTPWQELPQALWFARRDGWRSSWCGGDMEFRAAILTATMLAVVQQRTMRPQQHTPPRTCALQSTMRARYPRWTLRAFWLPAFRQEAWQLLL
jgi:hypothetical protein